MVSKAHDWATTRGDQWRDHLTGMEGMLEPVDEPLIEALRLEAPCRIADIACGGGGTTLKIQRRSVAGSVVHGFDISPSLIELARGRDPRDGLAFEIADVATCPPPEVLYDRLVSRYGIMFFDDPAAAFGNLLRWLVPRGRFAFAVWGAPADNPWSMIVHDVLAEVIDLPPRDPDAPGPFRYADADKLHALLEGAGFVELERDEWRGSLPVGGGLPAEQAAQFVLEAFSSFKKLLVLAGDDVLRDARRLLTSRLSHHQHGDVVRLGARVHIFTGVRSGAD